MFCALLPGAVYAEAVRNTYKINGTDVSYDDVHTLPNECLQYASDIYEIIWGFEFSTYRDDPDNYLRDLEMSELTLTKEHLKEYVSMAALGSCMRVCHYNDVSGHDVTGHSQVIVQKDENGFTVLEGGLAAYPYCREKYYTWDEFMSIGWLGCTYEYIKYIKCPHAPVLPSAHKYSGSFTVKSGEKDVMAEPWETSCLIRTVRENDSVNVVGYVYNQHSHLWYKTDKGDYISATGLCAEEGTAQLLSDCFTAALTVNCQTKPLKAGINKDSDTVGLFFYGDEVKVSGWLYDESGDLWYETDDGYYMYYKNLLPTDDGSKELFDSLFISLEPESMSVNDYARDSVNPYSRYLDSWYIQAMIPMFINTVRNAQD